MHAARPTPAEYRAALNVLRRTAPEEAAVVSGFVERHLRLLAAAREEQAGTAARIRELSRQAVAAAPEESDHFVVLDGETVSFTSSLDISERAIRLVDEVIALRNTPDEITARLQAVATEAGPVSVHVFGAAVQYAVLALGPSPDWLMGAEHE